MARIATANLDLGTYPQGANPGAGPQNVSETNPANAGKGLNGDRIKLDIAIGTEHNANGTHKDDKITGANLKAAIADGTTIEASAPTGAKTFRVKDGGVGTPKFADLSVTTGKLAANAVTDAKLSSDATVDANRAVGTNHIKDAAVTTGKMADDAVTAPKISHDNTRTKWVLAFGFDATGAGTYAKLGSKQTTATFGAIIPRGCSVTKVTVCSSDGATDDQVFAYGAETLAAGDRFTLYMVADGEINGSLNGASMGWPLIGCTTADVIVLVEFENDDA